MNRNLLITILSCALVGGNSSLATPNLEGTLWKLNSWRGENLSSGSEITATFNKNNLSGFSGCNRYTTSYLAKDATLLVNPAIAMTKKACPEGQMRRESQFLTALQGVEQYTFTAKGELQLFHRTSEGIGVMTFSPQNVK